MNTAFRMRSNGGKARAKKLTSARRIEIARSGGNARAAKLKPAKRRQIAKKGGLAKGKGRKGA